MRRFLAVLFVGLFVMFVGCGDNDDNTGTDADTDMDSDSDSDGDTDTYTDTDTDADTDTDTDTDADGDTDSDTDVVPNINYKWHTFYGSSKLESSRSIVADALSNVYLTGWAMDTWTGPSGENPLNDHTGVGNSDFFVLKLDSNGTYQWHTFYGASDHDGSYSMGIDGNGNVYMSGDSYEAWTGPNGESPLNEHSEPGWEFFILKLDSNGAYQWHTFYGSTDYDLGNSAAVDVTGNVYVSGYSVDPWVGPNGESPLHDHSGNNYDDLFVLKLDSSGAYQWHTFYGDSGNDYGNSVAVDATGNVYVTGGSDYYWTGPGGQNPLHAHSGNWGDNFFVLKLDPSGTYQWHTFYGSTYESYYVNTGNAVFFDINGNVCVAGESSDTWTGPSGESPLHEHSFSYLLDPFVIKLNPSGAYQWHTFLGSLDTDIGTWATSDALGNVYGTGYSPVSWTGPNGEDPLNAHSGDSDSFVFKLDSGGAYRWHAFFGSSNSDDGASVAVDGDGNVYLAGDSMSTWNGPSDQAPLHSHSGSNDIFVLKLAE